MSILSKSAGIFIVSVKRCSFGSFGKLLLTTSKEAQQILSGDSKVVLASGTESMSQTSFAVRNIRFGTNLGANIEFKQGDQQINTPMGITAENMGEKYKITRQECDEYAANNAGYFKSEIEPIMMKGKKGEETLFEVDEHPREVTIEQIGKLPQVFKKIGLVNVGNASVILGCKSIGCDQLLSVQREANIDFGPLYVNGGAISLGHPLAASGARITSHFAYELKRRNVRYGIGSAFIGGGGQGVSILFVRTISTDVANQYEKLKDHYEKLKDKYEKLKVLLSDNVPSRDNWCSFVSLSLMCLSIFIAAIVYIISEERGIKNDVKHLEENFSIKYSDQNKEQRDLMKEVHDLSMNVFKLGVTQAKTTDMNELGKKVTEMTQVLINHIDKKNGEKKG